MGSSSTIAQVIGAASVVLGIAQLVTGVLFVNDYKDYKPIDLLCNLELWSAYCKAIDYYIVAGSLAVGAGVLQIVSFIFVWKKRFASFAGGAIAVFIFCLAALILAVDQGALDLPTEIGEKYEEYDLRAKLFIASLGINLAFALGSGIGMYMLSRKK